jgi:DNA polymerase-3 subunit gamma/tau
MSYTVLARKYRPQIFADLAGQEHVSRTLANAIEAGRVAHAFLFTGARGVGKTTTARLLAKALNCEQGPTAAPCNQCGPCREITAGNDLDVLEIDGASNNSVDDVRRLQETLPFRPARDRFKVVIVDEVHMLSSGAFNAFLKTLEEPPEHVKFIFATTEVHKVPITIRSRCQRYDFRLIPRSVVAARVKEILAQEQIEADEEAVSIVVREADGSLRDALTVLDQLLAFGGREGLRGEDVARGLGIADRKLVLSVASALLDGDAGTCLQGIASISGLGLDIMHFARQLLTWMRDLVVLRVVGDGPGLVDRSDDERQQASAIAAKHSAQHLERSFAGLAKLIEEVGEAADPQLILEMGLVRLADRPPLEPLSELLARLQALEQRLARGGDPGGGGAGPGRDPSSGGPAGRVPRPPPVQAHASPEVDSAARLPAQRVELGRREPDRSGVGAIPVPHAPPAAEGRATAPSPSVIQASNGSAAAVAREVRPAPSVDLAPRTAPMIAPAAPALARPSGAGAEPTGRIAIAPSGPTAVAASSPAASRALAPAPARDPAPGRVALQGSSNARLDVVAHAGGDSLPQLWSRVLEALCEAQPALGAVLEHAVPLEVGPTKFSLGFAEGSFHGRQAASALSRQALGDAAERMLGQRPQIEVRFGSWSQPSLASQESARRQKLRDDMRDAALSHPLVRDAMDVFPEATEGPVDVQPEDDR